ncbi:hypothetical protein TVAG_120070 [Trichomonas vaginalis G3]|uniref:Uncharacterized protein n=1 Tax=Trichomonas vaginalis (strain ATCC PRA-98 / G3) TaxID=412133 RepID=A2D7F3_TRIV3|nr:glycoprotein 38 family [Trichomonas vaginalis G3]EAY23670.1 hypothetical protein TVAG_120070 [Trichomonas vaginalis G3]KAI5490162.1 glycoprotein 38 family [Trichomonas vaginalis G3]|eukprot:XP_001276918.1 hypothetical protein [Trichomonas vaginalis G3]
MFTFNQRIIHSDVDVTEHPFALPNIPLIKITAKDPSQTVKIQFVKLTPPDTPVLNETETVIVSQRNVTLFSTMTSSNEQYLNYIVYNLPQTNDSAPSNNYFRNYTCNQIISFLPNMVYLKPKFSTSAFNCTVDRFGNLNYVYSVPLSPSFKYDGIISDMLTLTKTLIPGQEEKEYLFEKDKAYVIPSEVGVYTKEKLENYTQENKPNEVHFDPPKFNIEEPCSLRFDQFYEYDITDKYMRLPYAASKIFTLGPNVYKCLYGNYILESKDEFTALITTYARDETKGIIVKNVTKVDNPFMISDNDLIFSEQKSIKLICKDQSKECKIQIVSFKPPSNITNTEEVVTSVFTTKSNADFGFEIKYGDVNSFYTFTVHSPVPVEVSRLASNDEAVAFMTNKDGSATNKIIGNDVTLFYTTQIVCSLCDNPSGKTSSKASTYNVNLTIRETATSSEDVEAEDDLFEKDQTYAFPYEGGVYSKEEIVEYTKKNGIKAREIEVKSNNGSTVGIIVGIVIAIVIIAAIVVIVIIVIKRKKSKEQSNMCELENCSSSHKDTNKNKKDEELSESSKNKKDEELSESSKNKKDEELSESSKNKKDEELSESSKNKKDEELSESSKHKHSKKHKKNKDLSDYSRHKYSSDEGSKSYSVSERIYSDSEKIYSD